MAERAAFVQRVEGVVYAVVERLGEFRLTHNVALADEALHGLVVEQTGRGTWKWELSHWGVGSASVGGTGRDIIRRHRESMSPTPGRLAANRRFPDLLAVISHVQMTTLQ